MFHQDPLPCPRNRTPPPLRRYHLEGIRMRPVPHQATRLPSSITTHMLAILQTPTPHLQQPIRLPEATVRRPRWCCLLAQRRQQRLHHSPGRHRLRRVPPMVRQSNEELQTTGRTENEMYITKSEANACESYEALSSFLAFGCLTRGG